jgi:hypothetical protein
MSIETSLASRKSVPKAMRHHPMIENNTIPTHFVATLTIFLAASGSFRMTKSTEIWAFIHEVKGRQNPKMIADERQTSS